MFYRCLQRLVVQMGRALLGGQRECRRMNMERHVGNENCDSDHSCTARPSLEKCDAVRFAEHSTAEDEKGSLRWKMQASSR